MILWRLMDKDKKGSALLKSGHF